MSLLPVFKNLKTSLSLFSKSKKAPFCRSQKNICPPSFKTKKRLSRPVWHVGVRGWYRAVRGSDIEFCNRKGKKSNTIMGLETMCTTREAFYFDESIGSVFSVIEILRFFGKPWFLIKYFFRKMASLQTNILSVLFFHFCASLRFYLWKNALKRLIPRNAKP